MNKASQPDPMSLGCRICGAVLPSHRLGGLCPACTWQIVMQPDEEPAVVGTSPARPLLLSIPGHTVLEEIARGGMGIVYRAQQTEPKRTVALKMLLPQQVGSEEMRERFRMETRAITALDHPAILPVYQVGEQDGLPFYTMKFAAGGTLATRRGLYYGQYRRIAELMVALAEAVQFAHERGILHRDLKPGNVLFDDAGRPYVSDFGLVKFLGAEKDLAGSVHILGTPHYMAPEVASGGARVATTASDLYSLGAILYELLAGRPPFETNGIPALLKKIAEEEPRPPSAVISGIGTVFRTGREVTTNPGRALPLVIHHSSMPSIPRDLETICLKCLAKEPERRYGSGRELAEELRRWLAGQSIHAHPVSRCQRVVKWAKRNPVVAILVVLLVTALILSGITLARSNLQMRRALLQSLLTQAQLARTSGRIEQRDQTLALIDRAANLLLSLAGGNDKLLAALRTEVAGALALPDLRPIARWSYPMGERGNTITFTEDLAHYVTAAPEGGFKVMTTDNHQLVRYFPGAAENPAIQLKLSQDGRWVAAIFLDGHAEVYALASIQPPRTWPGDAASRTDLEFLSDGHRILVAVHQQGLVVHDLANDTSRTLVSPPLTIATFKPDPLGQRVACFTQNELQVLHLDDGARLWSLSLSNGISRPAWSPDGRYLAIAESAQPFETTVFDLAPGDILHPQNIGVQNTVAHANLHSSGDRQLAPPTGLNPPHNLQVRVKAHFQDHELAVSRLAFHPDGQSLAGVSLDNRLVWRQLVQGGWRLTGQAGGRVLRFSSDGKLLAYESGHGHAGLLEVAPSAVFYEWNQIEPSDERACTLAVSPDGGLVATSSVHGVHLLDATTREQITYLPLSKRIPFVRIQFHPNGQALLYSGPGLGVMSVELIPSIQPRELAHSEIGLPAGESSRPTPSLRPLIRLGAPRRLSENFNAVLQGFAPDRRSLVVLEVDNADRAGRRAWLWPEANSQQAQLLAHGVPMQAYHLSPDGRWGVSSHMTTPDVQVWDPKTGRGVHNFGLPSSADTRPTPDGQWILVSSRDQHRLWTTGSWEPGPSWENSLQQEDWAVAFSADGQWIATTADDGQVEIRLLPRAELILALPPPQSLRLRDLQFSPNGRRLYLLQATGRLFEWDLALLRRELAKYGLDRVLFPSQDGNPAEAQRGAGGALVSAKRP